MIGRHAVFLTCFILIPACSGITCDQRRHRAVKIMNLGISKFSQGQHAAALADIKAALNEAPDYVPAHANLAKIYMEMKKWDDAQRHFNRVVQAEPGRRVMMPAPEAGH